MRKATRQAEKHRIIEAPYNSRIYNNFCIHCKYKDQISEQNCPLFVSKDAICIRFEYEKEELKKQYEEETLDNWAVTIWLDKRKPLEEIWAMSREKLRSVLTNKHYNYFKRCENERKILLKQALKERNDMMHDEISSIDDESKIDNKR